MDLRERPRQESPPARHPWEVVRAEVLAGLVDEVAGERLGRGTEVLDVGCGDLYLTRALATRYPASRFLATDTALDEELLAELSSASDPSNVEAFASVSDALRHRRCPVGLVLLADVLEHVADDAGFLADLCASEGISEGARVVISVPALAWLFSSHDRILGHERRYTRATVEEVARRAGLRVLQSGYFFSSLLPIRAVEVMKERVFATGRTATGVQAWRGRRGQRLLEAALRADAAFSSWLRRLGLSLPGLSCYVACMVPGEIRDKSSAGSG